MFPITTNLKPITTPWATYGIIGTNVLVHLIATWNSNFAIPSEIARTLGFVPTLFGNLSTAHRLVTCVFLHGDLIHLSGNMLFLLVFGQRVESEFGSSNFLTFYMTAGVSACLAHAIVESESTKPLIGASGAISGVLGAFLIANPRARITLVLDPTLILFLHRLTVRFPAWIFLSAWFALQCVLALRARSSNVAFVAHVGGFMFGVISTGTVYIYLTKKTPYKSLRGNRKSDIKSTSKTWLLCEETLNWYQTFFLCLHYTTQSESITGYPSSALAIHFRTEPPSEQTTLDSFNDRNRWGYDGGSDYISG